MNPLKILRKIVKFIRGGGTPLQILLACVLGMMLGMAPGFNLTTVALILAIVVLNVSVGLAMFSALLGKVLQLLLAPALFGVGHFLIHRLGLEGFIRWAGDTPVIALLNLHVYSLLGAIVLGLLCGLALGAPLAWIIIRIRKTLVAAVDKHAALQKISTHFIVRLLIRLLFGKSKMTMAEALTARPPMLRKSGLVVATVLVLLIAGTTLLAVDSLLPSRLAGMLGAANGAQVDVEEADFSLLSGRFRLNGLQVTDRNNPTHNLFAAERLETTVSISDLLAKRLVLDRVEVTAAATNSLRSSPGEVFDREEDDEEPEDEGIILTEYFEKADEYRKYLDYLKQVREHLARQERTAESPEEIRSRAKAQGYLAMSAKDILTSHPSLIIRELVIDRVSLGGSDIIYRLEGKQLSTNPPLNPQVMHLSWQDLSGEDMTQLGTRRKLLLGFDPATDSNYQLDLYLADLPVQGLSQRVPVNVEEGKATVSASGAFSAAALAMQMMIDVSDLQSHTRSGQGVLGLQADTSEKILSNLREIRLVGLLTGAIDRPRLQLDDKATLENMKAGLTGAARTELTSRIDEQIGNLAPGLPAIEASKLLDPQSLPIAPGDLLPGKAEDEEKQDPGRRLLEGLRR